jgi:hypothetical protein
MAKITRNLINPDFTLTILVRNKVVTTINTMIVERRAVTTAPSATAP